MTTKQAHDGGLATPVADGSRRRAKDLLCRSSRNIWIERQAPRPTVARKPPRQDLPPIPAEEFAVN